MMPWTYHDLLFFTVAVYGLAWLVTRAQITAPLRDLLRPVPFLGSLSRCIVCTGAWISIALALVLPWASLVADGLRVRTPVDLVLLCGWNVTALWLLGRVLGDAE